MHWVKRRLSLTLHAQLILEPALPGAPNNGGVGKLRLGFRGIRVRAGEPGGEQHPAQFRRKPPARRGGFPVHAGHQGEREPTLRERPGLVGAGHVHPSCGLDRRKAAHQGVALGQAFTDRRLAGMSQER